MKWHCSPSSHLFIVTLINDLFNRKFNPAFLLTALLAVAGTYLIESGQAISSDIWWGFLAGTRLKPGVCFWSGLLPAPDGR